MFFFFNNNYSIYTQNKFIYSLNESDIFFPPQVCRRSNPSLDNSKNHIDQSELSTNGRSYSKGILGYLLAYSATCSSKWVWLALQKFWLHVNEGPMSLERIKSVISAYIVIRLKHFAKQENYHTKKTRLRVKLSKLIIFMVNKIFFCEKQRQSIAKI